MQIDREVLREVEAALAWQSTRREDALYRTALNAPEDPHVEALCSRYGYGAVIDAAARLWARKDKSGAFFVGGCLGDNSASAALARLRKAMDDAQDAADAQKALDELICECGMTGPCMYSECKSPLLSCKAMEDGKDG